MTRPPSPRLLLLLLFVSFSWGRHDFDDYVNNIGDSDDQDHGDHHGGNDDHDLFTSHDQEEKEGAGGGLQFPT